MQNKIDTLIQSVQGKIEDGRQKAKEISENLAGLKEEHTKLTERRKDLWREDFKVDNVKTSNDCGNRQQSKSRVH